MENKVEAIIRPMDSITDDLVLGKDISEEEFLFLKNNLKETAKILITFYFPDNKWIGVLKDLFTCEFNKLGLHINSPFVYVLKWRLKHHV